MLTQPSLAEILAIHANEGLKFVRQAFTGEVDLTFRDVHSGEVTKRVHQKNMATRFLPDYMSGHEQQLDASWFRIFLSNDPRDMNQYRTVFRSTYFDAMSAVTSPLTVNVLSRTWTFVGIIPTPTSGHYRDIWHVGLNVGAGESVTNTYGRSIPNVVAATKLTSMLVQNFGTQVEVNYRLVFKRASDV